MSGDLMPLVSVPVAARMVGRSRSSMLRLLMRMAAADQERGQCDWLVRPGPRRKMMINLTRLEVAHPALFRRRYVDRSEYSTLVESVSFCQSNVQRQNTNQKALAANVRELRGELKRLQTGANGRRKRPIL